MSGFLRSFDRLISQSRLAQSGHKLLLRSTNSVLHPTAYYYHPLRALQDRLSLPQDIFELGLSSNALTRQANAYLNLLSHTEKESLQAEISSRIESNTAEIEANLTDISANLRAGRTEFPVQSVADIAYTLAFAQQAAIPASLNARELVQKHLLPVLTAKLGYASVHNIQDVLNALVKLDLIASNKDLVRTLLNTLAAKDLPSQLETIVNHAWTHDQYEEAPQSCTSACNIMYCRADNFARYIQAGGSTSTFAKTKFAVQELADQIVYRFVNPFLFRESRITKRFEARDAETDHQVFAASISAIATAVPETAQVVNTIKARL